MLEKTKNVLDLVAAKVKLHGIKIAELQADVEALLGKEPHRNSVAQYLSGEMEPSLGTGLAIIQALVNRGHLDWDSVRLIMQRKGFAPGTLSQRR